MLIEFSFLFSKLFLLGFLEALEILLLHEHWTNTRTFRRSSAISARIWSLYGKLFGIPGSFLCSECQEDKYVSYVHPELKHTGLPLRVFLRCLLRLLATFRDLVLDVLPFVRLSPLAGFFRRVSRLKLFIFTTLTLSNANHGGCQCCELARNFEIGRP